ncbi:MAG TPA: YchJ family metal-binding protein [Flavobacterium sp.]|uniref:YchJ family protein n=1 Tax=Flavobacterium sp. TaxID=239 RepID=UPI002B4B8D1A|nr:YchJ family metal-binding protein [Flavobacterium sp.]HLO73298.1 YchJ family metal-binding protein [Flavobacterium sp.]
MSYCYCGSSLYFQDCCKPYIKGNTKAPTAEALMRSRYSAYATGEADYLIATTHLSTRKFYKKSDIIAWSKNNQWLKLEILNTAETTVTFKAYFLDEKLKAQVHYEHSTFKFDNGNWFYVDGEY